MQPLGDKLPVALSAIINAAVVEDDLATGAQAGLVGEILAFGLLNANRHLATPSETLRAAAKRKLSEIEPVLVDLEQVAASDAQRGRARALKEAVAAYAKLFDLAAAGAQQQQRAIGETNQLSDRIGTILADVKTAQVAAMQQTGTETEAGMDTTARLSLGLAGGALVLGVGLA
ncbi:MAG: hypothetical protein FJX53_13335 [Alphaproteobacteria bacterium]|nr:hypothetical protein [Alphaproteobacteria bacterium]